MSKSLISEAVETLASTAPPKILTTADDKAAQFVSLDTSKKSQERTKNESKRQDLRKINALMAIMGNDEARALFRANNATSFEHKARVADAELRARGLSDSAQAGAKAPAQAGAAFQTDAEKSDLLSFESFSEMSADDRAQAALDGKKILRDDLSKFNSAQLSAFFKAGGKVADATPAAAIVPAIQPGATILTRAQFNSISNQDQLAFCKSGGKLSN